MRNVQQSTLNAQHSAPRPPEPGAPHSALDAERRVVRVLALLLLAALPALAERDPFWPIGYEPPKPEPVVKKEELEPKRPAIPAPPPKPPPPAIKPVSDQDWSDARKSITVSGFTRSTLPGTGETRTLAMINRRSYSAGDTLCITNAEIRFLWRIESVADRNLRLSPLKAERLAAAQTPANLQ